MALAVHRFPAARTDSPPPAVAASAPAAPSAAVPSAGLPSAGLPPVVLLHGFASSADEDFLATGWAEALAASGREALAVDLPGHGASPAIAADAEATTSAVVAAILEAVGRAVPGTEPFDVIGYSLGARLAWELPAASPRVRRLVLGGISPFEPFAAVDPAELAAALGGGAGRDGGAGEAGGGARGGAGGGAGGGPGGDAAPANPLVGIMAAMISAPGRDTASLARLIPGLASEPFSPQSGGPRVPTLLAAGDADQMAQGIESLAAALPIVELISVPGDHRGALDSAEFRAAAIGFLAG